MIMSEWRHNNGFLIKHTMRVAKEDFDTDPSDDYKKEIFDYLCEAANNYEQANEKIQSLQSTIDGLQTALFKISTHSTIEYGSHQALKLCVIQAKKALQNQNTREESE